jgi:tetratricopeptide (TPR) repeat protein
MSKEQLLQEFAEAYEQLIGTATEAAQSGVTRQGDTWGPREIVAHLAGWEVIATVHVPRVAAGMPPLFMYADKTQQTVLNEALNATMVTLVADQPLSTVGDLLRQAYQRDIEKLRKLDDTFFQPGEYVYERTKAAIEHCQEHIEELVLSQALLYQEKGKYAEAEPLFKRALAICEQALGPDHPHTQTVRHKYDGLLQEMGGNL